MNRPVGIGDGSSGVIEGPSVRLGSQAGVKSVLGRLATVTATATVLYVSPHARGR